ARLHAQLLAHEIEMHDLELARRVQRQFLPEAPPAVPGYRFAFRDLRSLAVQGLKAATLIERLSRLLASSTREAMFATLLYLEIDAASGAIELVNAGHLRPLLRQASGRVVA